MANRGSQRLLSLFVCVVALFGTGTVTALRCLCNNSEPHITPQCFRGNLACDSSLMCYAERFWNQDAQRYQSVWDCLDNVPDSGIPKLALCKINSTKKLYFCCNNSDFCNDVTLRLPGEVPVVVTESVSVLSASPSASPTASPTAPVKDANTQDNHIYQGLIIGLPVASVFLLILVLIPIIIVILRCRKKRMEANRSPVTDLDKELSSLSYELGPVGGLDGELTCTSGSGSGHPFLIQRTVARSIKIGDPIGNGRYGQVFVGWYQGEKVAVKKFASRDEHSWVRETEIYSTVLLRHDNILGFFASDMVSNNGVTELWLITQFHPNGSLYDYLNMEEVSTKVVLQMAISICSGLSHLHTELFGTQAKPAIAHRDMKSKNILVKNNLTCCIADFGLAVMKETGSSSVNIPTNPKQGTKRYMAPEILNETINTNYFESFKQVDIYALGLVFWEICRRCPGSGAGKAEEYEVPFQSLVPPDPSFEDMRRLVVMEKRQPTIPNRWHFDDLLREMTKTMRECWYLNSSARPTAVYLKKKLLKLSQEDKLDYYANQE